MTEKARLLYLVGDDVYFCSHRLPLAQAAVAAGYDVSVATHVTTLGERIAATGARVVPLAIRRATTNPLRETRAVAELVGLYRRLRPDVVHHIALKPVVYGSLAARLAGVPHVINAIAGMGWVMSSGSAAARLARPLLRSALRSLLTRGAGRDRVIVQTPEDRALVLAAGMAREQDVVLVRGAGVDLAEFAPAPEPPGLPLVVLAARMLWDKGPGDFVAAARELRGRARFVLVGDPDPSNRGAVPRAQLEAWAREGVVEWWGQRSDMAEVMRQAAIVCLPTTYGEGVPKVLLEAAATGRPMVVSDWPGCREVVHHESTGLLVPPRDPVALADALRRLLGDRALRAAMGAAARAKAEGEFGIADVVAKTLALYQSLTHRSR